MTEPVPRERNFYVAYWTEKGIAVYGRDEADQKTYTLYETIDDFNDLLSHADPDDIRLGSWQGKIATYLKLFGTMKLCLTAEIGFAMAFEQARRPIKSNPETPLRLKQLEAKASKFKY